MPCPSHVDVKLPLQLVNPHGAIDLGRAVGGLDDGRQIAPELVVVGLGRIGGAEDGTDPLVECLLLSGVGLYCAHLPGFVGLGDVGAAHA